MVQSRKTCVIGAVIFLQLMMLSAMHAGATDTRLIDAVKSGNLQTVQLLLKNRALVNMPEPDGTTALEWAVRSDDLEIARSLLAAGANANAPNRYSITPLDLAAANGNAAR